MWIIPFLLFSFSLQAKVYKDKKDNEVIIQKRWHKEVNQNCSIELSDCLKRIEEKQNKKIPKKASANEVKCYKNGGKIKKLKTPSNEMKAFCILDNKFLINLDDYNSYHD